MQIPKRRGQTNHDTSDEASGVIYLTASGLERLKRELEDIEVRKAPQAREDLAEARSQGDLSENAEYAEAKMRLGRLNMRIMGIKDRLKRVHIIPESSGLDQVVRLGSTVTVEVNGSQRTYSIVGTSESNPLRGRISKGSPLGDALIGRSVGETVMVKTPGGEMGYKIVGIE